MHNTHNGFEYFSYNERARVESPSEVLQRTWNTYYHKPDDVTNKMAQDALHASVQIFDGRLITEEDLLNATAVLLDKCAYDLKIHKGDDDFTITPIGLYRYIQAINSGCRDQFTPRGIRRNIQARKTIMAINVIKEKYSDIDIDIDVDTDFDFDVDDKETLKMLYGRLALSGLEVLDAIYKEKILRNF